MEEKPFAPSAKKLKKARERGEVPISKLLLSAITTFAILLIIGFAARGIKGELFVVMKSCFAGEMPKIGGIVRSVVFVLLLAFFIPLVVGAWQTRGLLAWKQLKPRWRQKNKLELGEVGIALIKLSVLGLSLFVFLVGVRRFSIGRLYLFGIVVAGIFVVLGILDWHYRKWKFYRQQSMTHDEKKEEQKEGSVKR